MRIDGFLRCHARRCKRDGEHRLQVVCVEWFRLLYPAHALLLVAVPNGGRRDAVTGARLKEEGVTAGVSDLVLFCPKGGWHGLLIEMKTVGGRQSAAQKQWQQAVEQMGYYYVICRSRQDFERVLTEYMNG